jgi:hypothetical protein
MIYKSLSPEFNILPCKMIGDKDLYIILQGKILISGEKYLYIILQGKILNSGEKDLYIILQGKI